MTLLIQPLVRLILSRLMQQQDMHSVVQDLILETFQEMLLNLSGHLIQEHMRLRQSLHQVLSMYYMKSKLQLDIEQ